MNGISGLCHNLPAEFTLLLQCANQWPDAEQANRIRKAAQRDIDWTVFIRLTERHRVVPHAYLALHRAADDLVPEPSMDDLARRYRENTENSLATARELARISLAANQAGIPVMCLKGPALAMQIYGGLHCRQFRDLDLYVPPHHVVPAARLLNELGYREQSAPLTSLRPGQLRRLMNSYKDVTLSSKKPGVAVELHWEIADFGQFAFADERLWNPGRQATLAGGRFFVLPPEERIVFLALHGGIHQWKRLLWLFDLAQALRITDETDESQLLKTASALGLENYMLLGLSLVRTLIWSGSQTSDCLSPRVLRPMELSCRAMLADESCLQTNTLALMTWIWRMARTTKPGLKALSRTFAPRIEHMHLSAPLAYIKRLQQLKGRLQEMFLPNA